MAVSPEFIQSQLKAIQSDLREMRFAADVDRRNTASLYNNLTAELGATIGGLDAKLELGFEVVNERIDRLEQKVDRLEEKLDRLEEKVDRLEEQVEAGFSRLDQLRDEVNGVTEKVEAGFARIDRLEEKIDRATARIETGFGRIEQLLNRS